MCSLNDVCHICSNYRPTYGIKGIIISVDALMIQAKKNIATPLSAGTLGMTKLRLALYELELIV